MIMRHLCVLYFTSLGCVLGAAAGGGRLGFPSRDHVSAESPKSSSWGVRLKSGVGGLLSRAGVTLKYKSRAYKFR